MHDCTTANIRAPGGKRPALTLVLLTLASAGLFTLQPLLNLGRQPLHINDQIARDQAYHYKRSTGLSPDPASHPEAIVQIFAARAWGFRGIFADHTWIAFKPANAPSYTVCQIKGWLLDEQGHSPLEVREGIPDLYWMGSPARLVLDLRGNMAEQAISDIICAVKNYPYKDKYRLWPGPNSNTFTAHIIRQVPQLRCVLPVTAIGRDYLDEGTFINRTPSNTGYQMSVYGLASVSAAQMEGLELSILGLTIRLDIQGRSIYLPGDSSPVISLDAQKNGDRRPRVHAVWNCRRESGRGSLPAQGQVLVD